MGIRLNVQEVGQELTPFVEFAVRASHRQDEEKRLGLKAAPPDDRTVFGSPSESVHGPSSTDAFPS